VEKAQAAQKGCDLVLKAKENPRQPAIAEDDEERLRANQQNPSLRLYHREGTDAIAGG
jgi:hypothetical protein